MAKRPLWYLMLATVVFGLAAAPAMAQDSGGSSGSDGSSSGSSSTSGATGDTGGEVGGAGSGSATTGGVSGSTGQSGEGPDPQGGSQPNCPASQTWDPQSMTCVNR